jgi:hypothetical protein
MIELLKEKYIFTIKQCKLYLIEEINVFGGI